MIHNQTSLPRLFKGIALFTPGGDLIYGIDSSKQAHWHIHLCLGLQQILGLSEPPHFLVPGYTATVDRWLEAKTQKIRTSAEIYPACRRYQPLLRVLFETEEAIWQTVPWQEEYCHPMMLETYRHQFPQLWEDHNLIIRLDPNFNDRPDNISTNRITDYELQSFQKPSLTTNVSVYSDRGMGSSANPASNRYSAYRSSFSRQGTDDIQEIDGKQQEEKQGEISRSPITSTVSKDIKPLANSSDVNNNGYVLRLFVSSDNAAVEQTLTKIYQLLEEGLVYPYTLKVIDISKNPEQAENYNIAATPTLVRVWPQPVRRIVGQLDDFERVLQILSSF